MGYFGRSAASVITAIRRVVAVLVAIFTVFFSMMLSTDIKFDAECQRITAGFYDGVEFNGYKHPSIASHLRNIAGYADGIVTIANRYELDSDELSSVNEDLKLALSYSRGDESYIYFCYDELLGELRVIEAELYDKELSERDESGLDQYVESITGAQSAIEESGYNESVSEFMREKCTGLAYDLAYLTSVDLPDYFGY